MFNDFFGLLAFYYLIGCGFRLIEGMTDSDNHQNSCQKSKYSDLRDPDKSPGELSCTLDKLC